MYFIGTNIRNSNTINRDSVFQMEVTLNDYSLSKLQSWLTPALQQNKLEAQDLKKTWAFNPITNLDQSRGMWCDNTGFWNQEGTQQWDKFNIIGKICNNKTELTVSLLTKFPILDVRNLPDRLEEYDRRHKMLNEEVWKDNYSNYGRCPEMYILLGAESHNTESTFYEGIMNIPTKSTTKINERIAVSRVSLETAIEEVTILAWNEKRGKEKLKPLVNERKQIIMINMEYWHVSQKIMKNVSKEIRLTGQSKVIALDPRIHVSEKDKPSHHHPSPPIRRNSQEAITNETISKMGVSSEQTLNRPPRSDHSTPKSRLQQPWSQKFSTEKDSQGYEKIGKERPDWKQEGKSGAIGNESFLFPKASDWSMWSAKNDNESHYRKRTNDMYSHFGDETKSELDTAFLEERKTTHKDLDHSEVPKSRVFKSRNHPSKQWEQADLPNFSRPPPHLDANQEIKALQSKVTSLEEIIAKQEQAHIHTTEKSLFQLSEMQEDNKALKEENRDIYHKNIVESNRNRNLVAENTTLHDQQFASSTLISNLQEKSRDQQNAIHQLTQEVKDLKEANKDYKMSIEISESTIIHQLQVEKILITKIKEAQSKIREFENEGNLSWDDFAQGSTKSEETIYTNIIDQPILAPGKICHQKK